MEKNRLSLQLSRDCGCVRRLAGKTCVFINLRQKTMREPVGRNERGRNNGRFRARGKQAIVKILINHLFVRGLVGREREGRRGRTERNNMLCIPFGYNLHLRTAHFAHDRSILKKSIARENPAVDFALNPIDMPQRSPCQLPKNIKINCSESSLPQSSSSAAFEVSKKDSLGRLAYSRVDRLGARAAFIYNRYV